MYSIHRNRANITFKIYKFSSGCKMQKNVLVAACVFGWLL